MYGATISVNVRYRFMNVRHADLEVGTNAEGRARIEGLPARTKTLNYDIRKDGKGAIVQQDVATVCRGVYEVSLKDDVKDGRESPR